MAVPSAPYDAAVITESIYPEHPHGSMRVYEARPEGEPGPGGAAKAAVIVVMEAFGVNVIVMPPRHTGFHHFHDEQDELYFVHSGTAKVEVDGEERLLGPGGMVHVRSTTPRRVSNAGDDDLVVLVVGGKGGYVERDGHLVDDADAERRRSFGSG